MTSTVSPTPAAESGAPTFPAGFLWGTATSAYQVEGAVAEDGRRPSIWDTFAAQPGAVRHGDTGAVACDHYHRMPGDVALMSELGFGAYRFSVAWPRVRPDGGRLNRAGLDFYSRLVDELLGAGIEPWVTLYHWDLPQALEDAGGWLSRDTATRFADYALDVFDALGDRVRYWTTLNEPWCSAFLGYTSGQHAPGRQEGVAGVIAAHHLLLGHGQALARMRERARPEHEFGITLNLTVAEPFDPDDAGDVAAAEKVDVLWNRLFLGPLFQGRYDPGVAVETAGMTWQGRHWQEFVLDGDLDLIGGRLDLLGVNYYHGDAASERPYARPQLLGTAIEHPSRPVGTPFPGGDRLVFPRRGLPTTSMDWEVQPEGLTRLLRRLRDDYAVPPMYITENGAAYEDSVCPEDGRVHDPDRVAFFDAHLRAVLAAIEEGVDVRGYFAWSLLDNFEWAYGYEHRMGIVYVDYPSQRRIPKDSARYFSRAAASGRLPRID